VHQTSASVSAPALAAFKSQRDLQPFSNAVELFDTDEDGAVDCHELEIALDFDMKDAEIPELFSDHDETLWNLTNLSRSVRTACSV
jgi:Ca2+-binding EF-hand superfamily protein